MNNFENENNLNNLNDNSDITSTPDTQPSSDIISDEPDAGSTFAYEDNAQPVECDVQSASGNEPVSDFSASQADYGSGSYTESTDEAPVQNSSVNWVYAQTEPEQDYQESANSGGYNAHSDSYYLNKSPYGPRNENSFYKQSTVAKKKKKYISVPAAVISLVVTAVISITGGAALSNIGFFAGDAKSNISQQSVSSVQENINNSSSYTGSEATNVTTAGKALTTPEIVDKVGPAVVGIVNMTTFGDAYGQFGRFYGNLDEEIEQGSGSGVIISSDGYIVTNNHVVENASKLTVILNSGEEYEAKTVGRDASTDLALLKIEVANLTYAQMGTSSDLRVGETAIAIGNPLGQEFAGTTTQGIISGLNRSVTIDDKTLNLIQTDAAINPGNSGGALVNEYGVLIGINTAKISSDTLEGLGFAIPIDEAKPIIQELMSNGYVTGRPVVGIAGRAVTQEDAEAYNLQIGVYVSSMTANGPAYMSGMKVGDIIVECEGEPIETVDDINEIKNKKAPGDELKFKVWRKGNYKEIVVILGEELPDGQ